MPAYDIDYLRRTSENPAKLLYTLWDIWRASGNCDPLIPEEKIIWDAWVYDSGNGNGLCDMLINERYQEVAAGLHAIRSLDSPEISLYFQSIKDAFDGHGIDCLSPKSLEDGFSRGSPPREVIEAAEERFLSRLWAGAIIESAQSYIERHIDIFRARQAKTNKKN
jgi:hypothetical protein